MVMLGNLCQFGFSTRELAFVSLRLKGSLEVAVRSFVLFSTISCSDQVGHCIIA